MAATGDEFTLGGTTTAATTIDFLDGLDLSTASLEDMTEALRKLEGQKQDVIEDIRQLRVRLENEKADQNDVYYYLHKKLDDNYDVISALERQLMVEAADRERAETEFSRRVDELARRRDEELGPMKEKLITMEEQLNLLHDTAENKREMVATRERLEKELESTRSVVESDLASERRKQLQEKQRVRRQVETHITELSTELLSKKEVELADRTVRATHNNEKLHLALHAKAKQAERMMIVNQALAFENNNLRNDVDLAKAAEVVLGKRVRLYYELVVGLKAQLERGVTADKNEEQELADLEESLASGGGGGGAFDAMSLTSEETSGAQVAWAGGACDGLVYESVDELRVAAESLQLAALLPSLLRKKHLHLQLKREAEEKTAMAEKAAAAATKMFKSGQEHTDSDRLLLCLLQTAETWIQAAGWMPNGAEAVGIQSAPMPSVAERAAGSASIGRIGSIRFATNTSGGCRDQRTGESLEGCSDLRKRGVPGSYRNRAIGEKRGHERVVKSTRSTLSERGKYRMRQQRAARRRRAKSRGGNFYRGNQEDNAPATASSSARSLGRSGGLRFGQRQMGAAGGVNTEILRELFYALVDALRSFQLAQERNRGDASGVTGGGGGNNGGIEEVSREIHESPENCGPVGENEVELPPAAKDGGQLPSIAKPLGGSDSKGAMISASLGPRGSGSSDGGGLCRELSTSDLSSVSVRSMYDFGAPEVRSVSTQTVAKHFPEKFAVVRPARKLVISSTFLTSNSIFSASTMSARGSSDGGGGSISSFINNIQKHSLRG